MTMKVDLLAVSAPTPGLLDATRRKGMALEGPSLHVEDVLEFAGRTCYQSHGKPNPATKARRDYIWSLIAKDHGSVLEHGHATCYVSGVSRSLTHELVRHRHLSFSQVSQRYVEPDYLVQPVLPPAFDDPAYSDVNYVALAELVKDAREDAWDSYRTIVDRLEEAGVTGKQAREAARCVLINAEPTELVVSGNFRAWREVIVKRSSPAADAEMRQLARMILDCLHGVAPSVFSDLVPE